MSSPTYSDPPKETDIISFSALRLAVTVGSDHWGRVRPQPVHVSLSLTLAPSYLDASGKTDDVEDSLNYGHLAKAVQKRLEKEGGYANARSLVEDVTDAAFGFAVSAAKEDGVVRSVRVVLQLPKQILLAGGFEVELTTNASDRVGFSGATARSSAGTVVRVTNLVLPIFIGVNPYEENAKQRVVTHLTFFEDARTIAGAGKAGEKEIDYPAIVQKVVEGVENSRHRTLEKLVCEIIGTAYKEESSARSNSCTNGPLIRAMTARCQKPSALSFADASEVEMTRTRGWFV